MNLMEKRDLIMSNLARHLNSHYGYSCQCWLSVDISNRYFNGSYRTWFATNINPQRNGHSSNPLMLYQELDKIVTTNDFNHSRIDQLRNRLQQWIAGSGLAPTYGALLTKEIVKAPTIAFRPQLWRIDLSSIHVSRLINLGQFPDEYQIEDLIKQEFEVIVP